MRCADGTDALTVFPSLSFASGKRSVKLNGKPYDKSYITHQQIMDGATVEFEMSSEPGEIWYR